jgi:UDP-glucose 4-epimerase
MTTFNHRPKILITGSEGHLGRHVVRLLCDANIGDVVCVHRNSFPSPSKGVISVFADLTQYGHVNELKKYQPDIVIHLAANIPLTSDDDYASKNNRLIDDNIFSLISKLDTFYIYISSLSVYEGCAIPWIESLKVDPKTAYAKSKYDSEKQILNSDNKSVILRLSSPYSAINHTCQSVLYHFAREAIMDRTLFVNGNGARSQDFVHGIDVARAILSIINCWEVGERNLPKEIYNIASGQHISMIDLANLVVSCSGMGKIQLERSHVDHFYKVDMPISRANNMFGWSPRVTLRDGIDQLIRRLRGGDEDWFVV